MKRSVLTLVALALVALVAFGALDEGGRQSLMMGLADPVFALDHFMVLIGVGLWAGRLGASAQWRLPAAFLCGALAGFLLAAGQPPSPFIETLVHLLVVGSMLLVAAALVGPIHLPRREVTTTMAMFGGCHGYLHWLEVGTAEVLWWGAGAAVASAMLMAMGVAVSLALTRRTG